jgi:serine/threonine protein kinase/tetratricopeptide (TPR) repeat protein
MRAAILAAMPEQGDLSRPNGSASATSPATGALAPGHAIGEYILEAKVGSGATGEVWRARHHVWKDRAVALKIPTSPDVLEAIRGEGLVHDDLSRLASPHLVRVLGLNVLSKPPYIVMEYVDGSSLRERMTAANRMQLPEAVRVLEGVLKGLRVAHEAGVVHRDIKPENVMLDRQGTPLLTDFSVARRLTSEHSLRMSIESDGVAARSIAGTLIYMSPEQRNGARVDRRSDIFAMGIMMFEMLTGELPQPGDRIGDFVRDVPAAVEEMFAKSFTRLERRYADAGAMLAALQALRQPGALDRPGARDAQPPVSHPGSERTAAVAPAARKTATPVSTREMKGAEAPKPQPAPVPVGAKGADARPNTEQAKLRKPVLSTRSLESVAREFESAAKPHVGAVRADGADAYEPAKAVTGAVAKASPDALQHPGASGAGSRHGRDESAAGGAGSSAGGNSAAAAPRTAARSSAAAGVADLARLLAELPDDDSYDRAKAAGRKGSTAAGSVPAAAVAPGQTHDGDHRIARAFDETLPALSAVYQHKVSAAGMAMYTAGKFRAAVDEFRRVLRIDAADWRARKGLAMSLFQAGRPKEALSVYRDMLAENPDAAEVWNNVGVVSLELSRLREAEQALLRAVELKPRYASARANLSAVYRRMGRADDAHKQAEMALEIDPENLTAGFNKTM